MVCYSNRRCQTMKIIYNKHILYTLEDFRNHIYYIGGKKAKDWKPGNSAESLAKYICNTASRSDSLETILSDIVGESVLIDVTYPEKEIRFDKYGHGREHDLAVIAHTLSGKQIFVGVEAKVNEEIGPTIGDAYLTFKSKEMRGEATNGCRRIESLMEQILPGKARKSDFSLRYQLLHATAGTLAADRALAANFDYYILLILTFLTANTNSDCVEKNRKDIQAYIKRINAVPFGSLQDTVIAIISNKQLIVSYQDINL